MITTTIGDILDGWCLPREPGNNYQADHFLYVIRDGDVVFYVGISESPDDRVMSHMGLRTFDQSRTGRVIMDNYPDSRVWEIDFYEPDDFFPDGVPSYFNKQHIEGMMINHLQPCLNVMGKRYHRSLPDKYDKFPKIANEGVILDSR